MTTTQELLKSSFELNLNNYGPEDVERLNDWAINAYAALEVLQAEVARLIRDRDSVWALKEHKEVLLSQMTSERDAALARLAEIEAQEQLIANREAMRLALECIYDHDHGKYLGPDSKAQRIAAIAALEGALK